MALSRAYSCLSVPHATLVHLTKGRRRRSTVDFGIKGMSLFNFIISELLLASRESYTLEALNKPHTSLCLCSCRDLRTRFFLPPSTCPNPRHLSTLSSKYMLSVMLFLMATLSLSHGGNWSFSSSGSYNYYVTLWSYLSFGGKGVLCFLWGFFSSSLMSFRITPKCLGLHWFLFILLGTWCISSTWGLMFLFHSGKFSAIISSNISSLPLFSILCFWNA